MTPQGQSSVDYEVTGTKVRKQLGDVIVTGEVTCTSPEGVSMARARRNWTVTPAAARSGCNWTSEGDHGISIPAAGTNFVDIVFTGTVLPAPGAAFKWSQPDNAGLPAGVTTAALTAAGSDKMTVRVIATPAAAQSTVKNAFFIRVFYECVEGGVSTFGTAIHDMTIYSLK